MAAGLIAFLILKPLTAALLRLGWTKQPFTAQENTVVQTFAMAMVTSLWILGFGSYLQVYSPHTHTRTPKNASRRGSPLVVRSTKWDSVPLPYEHYRSRIQQGTRS